MKKTFRKRKTERPSPQMAGSVFDQYYTWLWKRDQKRERIRRAHWLGQRPARMFQA